MVAAAAAEEEERMDGSDGEFHYAQTCSDCCAKMA
jgi:hypothetical protein